MRVNSDQIPEGPPWTPAVWAVGPDALVAQATHELWADQQYIDGTLASTEDAMSGSSEGTNNGAEEVIDVGEQGIKNRTGAQLNQSRITEWKTGLKELRKTDA